MSFHHLEVSTSYLLCGRKKGTHRNTENVLFIPQNPCAYTSFLLQFTLPIFCAGSPLLIFSASGSNFFTILLANPCRLEGAQLSLTQNLSPAHFFVYDFYFFFTASKRGNYCTLDNKQFAKSGNSEGKKKKISHTFQWRYHKVVISSVLFFCSIYNYSKTHSLETSFSLLPTFSI